MRRVEVVGERYGKLVVIREAPVRRAPGGQTKRFVECVCDCGTITIVGLSGIRTGKTKSCGCHRRTFSVGDKNHNYKHGYETGRVKKSELSTYRGMVARCTNPDDPSYGHWGARGIKVCDRWLGDDGFVKFLADMGPKPSSEHSLDRIDNDGPYSPENCRWATRIEQANNKRTNTMITYCGVTQSLADWARATGIAYSCLQRRVYSGWTTEEILTTPVKVYQDSRLRSKRLELLGLLDHRLR